MRRLPPLSAIALIIGSIILAALPSAAVAAPPVPEDFSAADQYVESLPTSRGSKPAREGPGGSAPVVQVEGAGAGQLEQIATSPELGAPEENPRKLEPQERPARPSVPSAAVNAIDDEGGAGGWLLVSLLLVSGVVAGIAGHRHFGSRKAGREI